MTQASENKPFVFRPSLETLKLFRGTSAEDRLNWLEDARRFVHDYVSPEKLEQWKKISGR